MSLFGRSPQIFGLSCLFLLSGCGLPKAIATAPLSAVHSGPTPTLAVTIAPAANDNSAVAVDIALVRDSKLLKALAAVKPSDWFQNRRALELANPKTLEVLSWQWVPGQQVTPIPLDLNGNIKGAVVFASYSSPKVTAVVVDPRHGLVLNLLNDQYVARAAQ